MQDASWPLQKAVFSHLEADTALMAEVTAIYDHVPANAVFPFITFGSTAVNDWSTKTFKGQEHRFEMHSWSNALGYAQVKQLANTLMQALHNADLVLDGHELVLLRHEFSNFAKENDGNIHHAICRYRALTCAHI